MGIVGATAVRRKRPFWIWPCRLKPLSRLTQFTGLVKSPFSTTEKQKFANDVSHYNNFYEFGTDKSDPAKNAQNSRRLHGPSLSKVRFAKPRKLILDEILKLAPLEERILPPSLCGALVHRCAVDRFLLQRPRKARRADTGELATSPSKPSMILAKMPQAKYGGIDFP